MEKEVQVEYCRDGKVVKYHKCGKVETHYYDNGIKIKECYYKDDVLYRLVWYYKNGNIEQENYFQDSKIHRENGPAIIWYDENGNIEQTIYYQNGKLHRLNGPAHIYYDENGNIVREEYYINGMRYDDMFKYLVMVGSMEK